MEKSGLLAAPTARFGYNARVSSHSSVRFPCLDLFYYWSSTYLKTIMLEYCTYRRLGVRYSQSLLSRRRAASLPAKEPFQEPTWADSGDVQLRQATVEAGQMLSEPSPATSSDVREVTGGQGVAGSNPAVPTVHSLIFEQRSKAVSVSQEEHPHGGEQQGTGEHEEAGVAEGEFEANAQTRGLSHGLLPHARCL